MDNNIDFKDLWKKQVVSEPNMDDLMQKLNQFKKQSLLKLIVTNVLLIATSLFIIYIWYAYQPQLITTKLGIVLVILAMFIYLIAYNKLFTAYQTIDNTQSNSEYLQKLIGIRTKQQFMQSTMLNLYFVLLSSGICLYMYEYALKMKTEKAVLAYALTVAWIAFNWFYTRPRQMKKQQLKINELIGQFEKINKQLNND
ncbi:MAG: hypothetical protein V4538_10425 [Bacteroidota bacterium]